MIDYEAHDATALAALVASGQISADELLDAALVRVERDNRAINAVTLVQEGAARAAIAAGLPDGPLRGVPFLLKDLGAEAVAFPSHNGSCLLHDTRYSRDSTIFERLRATGVVTFGRTTAPEGGIGPVTESAVYGGPTRNLWDLGRTPGGSSGGRGPCLLRMALMVAVRCAFPHRAAGFSASRRRGRGFPMAPMRGEGWAGMAIDGFLTRSVRDSAALMNACAGPDLGAPYHAPPLQAGYLAALARPPRRLRVAICPTTFDGVDVHPACRRAVEAAGALLGDLGHAVVPARPRADHNAMMRAWTRIVACGTALGVRNALSAKGRALRQGDLEGVSRGAIAYAAGICGADYLAAVAQVHAYGRDMVGFFTQWDILLSPTLAEPPARIGRFAHLTEDYEGYRIGPDGVFAYSPFCAAFNASGQPAASLPLGWTDDGLPVGVHLAAAFGEDELLIALCGEIEAAQPWFHRRPPPLSQ